MNDLERDLRTLLDEKAARAGAPMPDARLLRRARRRQVWSVLGGAAVALAAVAGAVLAVSAFGPSDPRTPAEPSDRLVTTTVNGVTIQHPEDWSAVDPSELGWESRPADGLPRLVVVLASGPVTEDVACPGLTGAPTDGILMTVQEQPLDLVEGRSWPARLEPLDTEGLGQTEIGPSGCFGGWTLRTAIWSDAGRTFEAFVGYGPDATDEDRAALEAAFASMRFAPTEGGSTAVRLAAGTAGGEDWDLVAELVDGFLNLSLQYQSGGIGTGFGTEIPGAGALELTDVILGEGDEREVVVFGGVTSPIVRLEVTPTGGGAPVTADVLDVPDAIGGERDAFVLAYRPSLPELGATITAYDAAGEVVATDTVTPHPEPTDPGEPLGEGTQVASGEGWALRIDDSAGLCVDIQAEAGGEGSCTSSRAEATAMIQILPLGDRAVAYGFLPANADRVVVEMEDGSIVEATTAAAPQGFSYVVDVYAVELPGASGRGRISILDDGGNEIGSATLTWTPQQADDVRITPPGAPTG